MNTLNTRIAPSVAILAILVSASSAFAQNVVDWTDSSIGSVPDATVTFSGGSRTLFSGPDVAQAFSLVNMTAPVSAIEGIEFRAADSTTTAYTVSFSSLVTGVMLHIGSLASTINFDRPITKLSGQSTFVVSGSTLTGSTVATGGFSDANGSIYLGDLQTFSFTVGAFPGSEGIGLQVVTGVTPVPEPTALSLMFVGIAGILMWRRRAS